MKNNILKLIKSKGLILIFILIITLPLFQNYTQLFNDKLLNEKKKQTVNPTYNKKEPISKYFSEKEKYFGDTFGFRDYFIRLSNYTDVNLFNKSPSKDVVIGKNDYLYSSEELNDYNRTNTLSDEDINKIANNIIILQNNLKNIGINFAFTVAPNKSTIYPEYMKTGSINPNDKSNLEKLEKVIAEKSINYIDYKKLMLENKDKYALYYKRDTHWNNIAATLVGDELIKTIGSFYDLGEFSIKPIDIKEKFRQCDLDDLLGIKTPILENTSTPDIKFSKNKLPKTLVYHDSFYYNVLPMLDDFFVQRIDLHNLNSPFHSTFDQFSQNTEIVVFEIVERYLGNLLNYDFNVFNDDLSKIKDYSSTSLNLDIKNPNNKAVSKDIAFYPYSDYMGFASLSKESSITWDVNKENANYILLEFENVPKYENLSLAWADENGDLKENQIANFILSPQKTTYLIEIKNPMEITKLRLSLGNKSNVNLNLKEIKIIN
ncbi:alginate O-acetyltransferase AlgX-related protein [Clostridium gasigenes]|uniref:AlgX/AlgJ SGNH hydrolase-like domain-containing protein n=1 Tax=Clostridium gasigenes TaxID=94869 RepID=A0A7X0SC60_9CLOT|nr:hypothetical protein [Clostridium gasigenes]MBB6713512.1 hypothetical protein [Clostridium gasigenes]